MKWTDVATALAHIDNVQYRYEVLEVKLEDGSSVFFLSRSPNRLDETEAIGVYETVAHAQSFAEADSRNEC